MSIPEIKIEKGDNINVWACKGDSCDPTSVNCYDSNGTFVKDLPNKKDCGIGVSHCIRYGNFFASTYKVLFSIFEYGNCIKCK